MVLKERKGFFGRLSERIGDAIMARPKIDEELFEELEEILITSDIGLETTMGIIDILRERVRKEYISDSGQVKRLLAEIMAEMMDKGEKNHMAEERPLVVLMIGINGGGKTTTIGKLAHMCISEGEKVLLGAGDTFRAAAADQLDIWGKRVGANVVRHGEGADPAAVLFDTIASAKAKSTDVVIFDTAGRLQNKKNLMEELAKINRVIDREWPEAQRETLLVLDATTGKNAVSQAKEFGQVADLTGVVLTKLDGTAKGGIALTITNEFDLPVKFVGVGEKTEDLRKFEAEKFVGGIFHE